MKKYLCIVTLLFLIITQPKESISPEEYITEIPIIPLTEDLILNMDLDIHSLIMTLDFYGIEHKDVVLAQAILETGHFTSTLCVKDNNLFGLYNSDKMEMHSFDHWSQSVKAYKKWIQRRYKETDDSYYHFLRRIKYAEDPDYIPKLIKIVERNNLSELI